MNKQHIVDEIIRTAKENNGTPLGRQKFEKETGIKYSDWYGKYWAKWSDAVRDAGFKPNTLTSAHDGTFLIEQAILLIVEIKKFPASGDFRLKAHRTQGFPSHTAFDRLGNKVAMAQKILDYCDNKPEYQDVIDICKVKIASLGKRSSDSKEGEIQFGYVYLMKSGRYYKIGKADCVEKRSYEIGIKLPEELKIMHKIKTDDPFGIEKYWHDRFADKRKGGEWFDLSGGDINAFKRRKFM
jgi:hypothetical protein